MRQHFRFLPSTKKLVARLKRLTNRVAELGRVVRDDVRTPLAQRTLGYSAGYPAVVARQATVLCATLAHVRGHIHAGQWSKAEQEAFIRANVVKSRFTAGDQAAILAALDVPAKERARLVDHAARRAAFVDLEQTRESERRPMVRTGNA